MHVLPDATRLGPVQLTVAALDRTVPFYEDVLGFSPLRRDGDTVVFGAGDRELVVLHEDASAQPARRASGLFHVAYLYPSRTALADAVQRLARTRTPLTGASDHGVSEALYLHDPEGNGIELYADRPRAAWPPPPDDTSRVGMYTIALDVEALLGEASGEDPQPAAPGTVVGHLHLHNGDLDAAGRFYGALGLELMTTYPGALFLAAGGYHHHLGVNTWRGEGIPPQPEGALGLHHWTIELGDDAAVGAARDALSDAGYATAPDDGGFVARDPGGLAVLVRP